ncbi:hypothetical protein D3C72_1743670 [compost metagenome]
MPCEARYCRVKEPDITCIPASSASPNSASLFASHSTESSPPPCMTAEPEAISLTAPSTCTVTLAPARSRLSAVSGTAAPVT